MPRRQLAAVRVPASADAPTIRGELHNLACRGPGPDCDCEVLCVQLPGVGTPATIGADTRGQGVVTADPAGELIVLIEQAEPIL
jgi:hypothetical protein